MPQNWPFVVVQHSNFSMCAAPIFDLYSRDCWFFLDYQSWWNGVVNSWSFEALPHPLRILLFFCSAHFRLLEVHLEVEIRVFIYFKKEKRKSRCWSSKHVFHAYVYSDLWSRSSGRRESTWGLHCVQEPTSIYLSLKKTTVHLRFVWFQVSQVFYGKTSRLGVYAADIDWWIEK